MTTINPKQRTIARENILKVLYQQNLNEYAFSDILKTFIEKRKYDKDYFENIISLIEENNKKIVSFIEDNTDLKLESLIPIDRAILMLSVCELIYRNDVPKKVILNESINIAKKYSTDESYKFINNILDQLLRCFEKND